MSITTNNNRELRNLIFIILTFISFNSFGKGQRGDSFRTFDKSLFLQGGMGHKLNSLQVLSRPLPGEPHYLFKNNDQTSIKSFLNKSSDDFHDLMNVFPNDILYYDNIYELSGAELKRGHTNNNGWSYHIFSSAKGGLAQRYSSPFFKRNDTWNERFQKFKERPSQTLIDQNKVDILSPIEKYEYLIGNTSFNLTQQEWQDGQKYMDTFGEVPSWIGICHGSSPASMAHSRPAKAIKLKSFNSSNIITFYPSDIKALISYLWAVNGGPSAMVGARCGESIRPNIRPSSNCLDNNPATFHLSIVNLVGIFNESLIIDTSAGHTVWNRPVISYRYRYYRPGTKNMTNNLNHALISINDYNNDPFAQYRSHETTHIVGVWMEITYLSSIRLNSELENSARQDRSYQISYRYDLEIDKDGIIIGGEWQNNNHPDFMWVVAPKYLPKSIYDYTLENVLTDYSGELPLPKYVLDNAVLAAQNGRILFSIINTMILLSNESEDFLFNNNY